ncbi:MAG TPA: hypothetical protein VGZ73_16165 [Bryobacteraceae bacterium]|jgi:hypothetical protein|nr:hypothetical protein [Bryobacteraceae bacterium]
MRTCLKYGMKPVSITLSLIIIFQFRATPVEAQTTLPTELNIVVVQGEGALNKVRQRVTQEPIIQVEDENHKPISGAAVVFTLPTEGATGDFGNGSKTLTVLTDSRGQAAAQGLRVNQFPGKLPIHINVSYRGLTARTNITQFDEGPPVAAKGGGGHGALIAILVIVGAGAAGGAFFALRKNTNNSGSATINPPPVSIGVTPGTGTITGPH